MTEWYRDPVVNRLDKIKLNLNSIEPIYNEIKAPRPKPETKSKEETFTSNFISNEIEFPSVEVKEEKVEIGNIKRHISWKKSKKNKKNKIHIFWQDIKRYVPDIPVSTIKDIAAVMSGEADLSVTANRLKQLAIAMEGNADLVAQARVIKNVAIAMEGNGNLASNMNRLKPLIASFDGDGSITSVITRVGAGGFVELAAGFDGDASVVATLERIGGAIYRDIAIALTGDAEFTATPKAPAVSYVGVGSFGATRIAAAAAPPGYTLNPGYPSDTLKDDLLFMWGHIRPGNGPTWSLPAGWTLLQSATAGTNFAVWSAYRWASANAAGMPAVTIDGPTLAAATHSTASCSAIASIAAFRGCNFIAPWESAGPFSVVLATGLISVTRPTNAVPTTNYGMDVILLSRQAGTELANPSDYTLINPASGFATDNPTSFYPWTKPFTHATQFDVGAAFNYGAVNTLYYRQWEPSTKPTQSTDLVIRLLPSTLGGRRHAGQWIRLSANSFGLS